MYSPSAQVSLPTVPITLPELLFVDTEEVTARYVAPLREKFRVTQVTTTIAAMRQIERTPPALVVTELAVADGSGEDICRAAKHLRTPATVLITTANVEQVPSAIDAGCDAVLLKPFAPNLLFARIGHLLRSRSSELRYRSLRQHARPDYLEERTDTLFAGTNHHWPNTQCPYCTHAGVTSFEFTSYRRAWYACLECRKVWLAKRQE